MTGRRGLVGAVAGCAVAGALLLSAGGRSWGHAGTVSQGAAVLRVDASGRDVSAAIPACGLALLVLGVALVAARGWWRRVVGAGIVAVGAVALAVTVAPGDRVRTVLLDKTFASSRLVHPVTTTAWSVLAVVAAALAVVVGAYTVVAARRWPAMGARYEPPTGAVAHPDDPERTAASTWDALDRGEDPTA